MINLNVNLTDKVLLIMVQAIEDHWGPFPILMQNSAKQKTTTIRDSTYVANKFIIVRKY